MGLATTIADAQTTSDKPSLFVITADDVHVRAGAADSYYPFGLLQTGDLVAVTGEKFNWARVATYGPAFSDSYGFIKQPQSETARLQLAPDGNSALTLGRVDVLAPNLNTSFNPKDSWKPIARLNADQQIAVLETTETDRETVYKVALPVTGVGWISTTAITPATPAQAAAWDAAMNKSSASTLLSKNSQTVGHTGSAVKPVDPNKTPAGDAPTVVSMGTAADATDGPTVATPPSKPPKQKIDPELAALEREYEKLSGAQQTPSIAEIRALQQKYTAIADRNQDVRRTSLFAQARAKQLYIWADLQDRRAELAELRTRVGQSAGDADEAVVAMDANSRYIIMGRLSVSRVYDGGKLPQLYRLQEPGTGRTVAYLRPSEEVDLVPMLGQLIGIVGDKSYDPGLRLTLVTPRRIDLLAPKQ
jgi:hypothetical protein